VAEERPDRRLLEQLALKDVAAVKTPTIFFVGERDPRGPDAPIGGDVSRAQEQWRRHPLYIAPREPHGWAELRHQLFKLNAEIEWFEKYATKRPFTWEKVPADDQKELKSTAELQ
jgi:hypothetical protein